MLKKRVIPVLLLKNNRMVKGKMFSDYRDTGAPISQTKIYNSHSVDELIFLDIEGSLHKGNELVELIQEISKESFMPFSVGGGISTIQDIRNIITAGADKVIINSAAIGNPKFISQASNIFGKQAIIISVDVKKENNEYIIYSQSGKKRENVTLESHLQMVEEAGAGEIFLNSIDRDGMMDGYDIELLKKIKNIMSIPVIICGGAGNFEDLYQGFLNGAHAVACASLFHFGDNNPTRARSFLLNKNIAMKNIKSVVF
jgi:cyclase